MTEMSQPETTTAAILRLECHPRVGNIANFSARSRSNSMDVFSRFDSA
ncbi:MAG: hypothetical protein U5J78_03060 [Parasphingorhabdus sp.]|nr:hypothetical protein [Parasphingorhabdus sp.]